MERLAQTGRVIDSCLTQCIHEDVIRSVQVKMPDDQSLSQLADFYKLFGDCTRLGIIWALAESEMCVCDLCVLMKMKQPAISHQLRTLKQMHIVKYRREGKVVYYSLEDQHINKVLEVGRQHLREAK